MNVKRRENEDGMLNRDRKRRTCVCVDQFTINILTSLKIYEFSLRLSQQNHGGREQIGKERENRLRAKDWPRLKILG